MPWLHTFLCMVVPVTNHLVSGAVLNQAIVEWNALFKIQPNSRDFLWRLSTRWSQAFCFCFVLRVASDCGHLSLCGPFRNSSSESPLRYIGSVDAVCKSHFLHPVFHYWKWLIFFNCFDSGEEVDIWRKLFSRLPIRTIVNPVVKSTVVFSSTLSRADHIDQSRKLQTEKKMNECFPTVVCDYTLMISWVSLFCYRNSFCNGCR